MTVAGGTQGGGGGGSGLGASCGSSSSSSRGGGGGSGGCGALVPGFSRSFSLLLLRCLLPPPTARPPASPLHRLRFTGSPCLRRSLARSLGMMTRGRRTSFPSFRPGREEEEVEEEGGAGGVGVPQRRLRSSLGEPGPAVWLRGEAATSCFPAPPLMLLSGRRNSQWDRSPSSAFTPLTAGVRSPHLRMGAPLTVKMRAHGCL